MTKEQTPSLARERTPRKGNRLKRAIGGFTLATVAGLAGTFNALHGSAKEIAGHGAGQVALLEGQSLGQAKEIAKEAEEGHSIADTFNMLKKGGVFDCVPSPRHPCNTSENSQTPQGTYKLGEIIGNAFVKDTTYELGALPQVYIFNQETGKWHMKKQGVNSVAAVTVGIGTLGFMGTVVARRFSRKEDEGDVE